MRASAAVIRDLAGLLGEGGLLHAPSDTGKYDSGYRYGRGRALAVARPDTLAGLRSVVRYCYENDLRIIAQGASTGLLGRVDFS